MRNGWLEEAQVGIKIAGRNINKLRYEDDTMKVKEESENVGLKLNTQNTQIMAPGPITSQQTDGETMVTVRDFILGGPQITANGDCMLEIKRHLLLARIVMTNLNSILKSRDVTLPTKVHLSSQGYGFSSGHVQM